MSRIQDHQSNNNSKQCLCEHIGDKTMKRKNKILKASDEAKSEEYEKTTKPSKKVIQIMKPSDAVIKGTKITFKIK